MHEVAEAVRRRLEPVLAAPGAGLCVALSGGLDSSVLLHVLARANAHPLRAIYVDHQLHPDSAAWGRHCEQLCRDLAVPFSSIAVTVDAPAGEGPEAAARRARYRALAGALAAGEVLVTAHHQDDQAETLFLNLMRGAGVAGLAGIPRDAGFAAGRLWRPLLDLPRPALRDYAHQAGLAWIEDPANVDARMDRNFLRHSVLPVLASRWPGLRATVGRSARLCGEAAALVDELATLDARRVMRGGRVSVPALAALGKARQRNVIRYLCRRELGTVPTEARLREGLTQLLDAGEDRRPLLAWAGGEIRRYRSALYLMPALAPRPAAERHLELAARPGACLALGESLGRLRLVRGSGQGLAVARLGPTLTVGFRAGGERIRPAGDAHSRELKKLLQERGVVPWMRDRIPLVFSGGSLAAVGDLWVAADFAAAGGEPGLRVRWDRHPAID